MQHLTVNDRNFTFAITPPSVTERHTERQGVAMGKSKRKKQRQGAIGRAQHSTPLFDDLLDSAACGSLNHVAARLLIDVIRHYCRVSAWDTAPPPEGFTFTWRMASFEMSERKFWDARAELVEQGFLDAPPEIQPVKPGMPKRFLFSTRWQSATPSAESKRHSSKKKRRLRRQLNRRQTMFDRMAEPKIPTNGGRKK